MMKIFIHIKQRLTKYYWSIYRINLIMRTSDLQICYIKRLRGEISSPIKGEAKEAPQLQEKETCAKDDKQKHCLADMQEDISALMSSVTFMKQHYSKTRPLQIPFDDFFEQQDRLLHNNSP